MKYKTNQVTTSITSSGQLGQLIDNVTEAFQIVFIVATVIIAHGVRAQEIDTNFGPQKLVTEVCDMNDIPCKEEYEGALLDAVDNFIDKEIYPLADILYKTEGPEKLELAYKIVDGYARVITKLEQQSQYFEDFGEIIAEVKEESRPYANFAARIEEGKQIAEERKQIAEERKQIAEERKQIAEESKKANKLAVEALIELSDALNNSTITD